MRGGFSDAEERAESRRVRTLLVYSGAGRVQLGLGGTFYMGHNLRGCRIGLVIS